MEGKASLMRSIRVPETFIDLVLLNGNLGRVQEELAGVWR